MDNMFLLILKLHDWLKNSADVIKVVHSKWLEFPSDEAPMVVHTTTTKNKFDHNHNVKSVYQQSFGVSRWRVLLPTGLPRLVSLQLNIGRLSQ